MKKDILTFDEFVNYTGLSRSAAYKATHKKELPYFKPRGGRLYFKLEDVKAWLLQGRVSSNEELESIAHSQN